MVNSCDSSGFRHPISAEAISERASKGASSRSIWFWVSRALARAFVLRLPNVQSLSRRENRWHIKRWRDERCP